MRRLDIINLKYGGYFIPVSKKNKQFPEENYAMQSMRYRSFGV